MPYRTERLAILRYCEFVYFDVTLRWRIKMNLLINLIIYLVIFGLIWWLVAMLATASASRLDCPRAVYHSADHDRAVGLRDYPRWLSAETESVAHAGGASTGAAAFRRHVAKGAECFRPPAPRPSFRRRPESIPPMISGAMDSGLRRNDGVPTLITSNYFVASCQRVSGCAVLARNHASVLITATWPRRS